MLGIKLSSKIGKYLNKNNQHHATKILAAGNNTNNLISNKKKKKKNKKNVNNYKNIKPPALRPVNLFHEVGLIVTCSPELTKGRSIKKTSISNDESSKNKKRTVKHKHDNNNNNNNSKINEIKYDCNVCSVDGIYTGRSDPSTRNSLNDIREAFENPHESIEFHTWKELDEERLNSVNMIIQRAIPTLQLYDKDGELLGKRKDAVVDLFAGNIGQNRTKDPLIPTVFRTSKAYDTIYNRQILKFVHDSVSKLKMKNIGRNKKRKKHLMDLYEILHNNLPKDEELLLDGSMVSSEANTSAILASKASGSINATNKYPFANALPYTSDYNIRQYHFNGDLYDYAAMRRRKKYAKLKAKQKKTIADNNKNKNNIINMTMIDNDDPDIESLINNEQYENLIGYFLGDGELIKHAYQAPYFKLVSNAYGVKVSERYGTNINYLNRGRKFKTHWLKLMDTITSSLPHMYLTDISFKEGERFSRKLSYRIYTEQSKDFEPLFRDFMRKKENTRRQFKFSNKKTNYIRYEKKIPDNIESYLTPRVVAHWYLGKGDILRVNDNDSNGMSMIVDDDDDLTTMISLRLDNWRRMEDVELLQRGLRNKLGIDSTLSLTLLTDTEYLNQTPMSNFLIIEEHHTEKFLNLISPHVPEELQQTLRQITLDKIALDRTKYEISTQQMIAGWRKSTSMQQQFG